MFSSENPYFESSDCNSFKFGPHDPRSKTIKYVGNDKKVLDVGCAIGFVSRKLRENGCYVVGIEIDKEIASIASKNCDKVIIADVENLTELPFPEGFFDVIFYSETLEHFKRPDLVLIRFKKYLQPNGYVVASVPNIARLENRLNLLFGKFDYPKFGIISTAHLRFFTLKTIKQLFESTGYEITNIDYTGLASKYKIARLLPTLFSYGFVIIAKPI